MSVFGRLPRWIHGPAICASLLGSTDSGNAATSPPAFSPDAPAPIIQSHRGAGVLAAENTIEAFELGWKLGTYPECDVRTTRDGVIVTFHDADFRRVGRGADEKLARLGVQDLTFAELQHLDVGTQNGAAVRPRRISRLSDAFAAMRDRPERHLYLDIKQVDLRQLAAEVQAAAVERQIILATPKPAIIREWKTLVPDSATLLWLRGSEASLRARLAELRAGGFAGITQIQLHLFPVATLDRALALATAKADQILDAPVTELRRRPDRFTLSDDFIRTTAAELRARGILLQALPYTDDPSVYGRLLDLGVASFATDHPDVALRETATYFATKSPAPR